MDDIFLSVLKIFTNAFTKDNNNNINKTDFLKKNHYYHHLLYNIDLDPVVATISNDSGNEFSKNVQSKKS
jgi:hypothetical protein